MTVQNLIINGGFETGTLSPWAGINATISMQYSHSGFFSTRLQGGNTVSYIAQIVPINPGEGFEFLVSLAKVGLAPAAPVIIQVIYLDNLSISTGNGFFTNIPVDRIPNANNDTWLEIYQTTIPAPPNTTQAVIVVNTLPQVGTADILVDDVSLLTSIAGSSYGNFWQNTFVSIPNGQAIPFNNSGPSGGGIALLNPTTISIPRAGDYEINYVVTVTPADPIPEEQQVSAFLNGVIVPNFQSSFGIRFSDPDDVASCFQITGTAIISIPTNSTLQLRNTSLGGDDLDLCNLVESGAALTIKRLG